MAKQHEQPDNLAALSPAQTAAVRAAGLDPTAVARLCERARQEVDEGLLPSVQIALARRGEVVFERAYGAQESDLICVFSATKALTAATAWLLLEEGAVSLDDPIVRYVPEFGSHGKEAVQIVHLLTHSAGFPHAPFKPLDWLEPSVRLKRWAQWRLDWAPGSAYEYHPSSSMWILAEVLERVSGTAFTTLVQERVLAPLGMDTLYLGEMPGHASARVLPVAMVGELASTEEYAAAGLVEPPATEVTDAAMLSFNDPAVRSVGMPGGGAVASAAGLALLHQALLHGGLGDERLWGEETLAKARTVVFPEHRDRWLGCAANRGLGLVIAGDADRGRRGFAPPLSPHAFGHNGAGGQLAWADPDTGLSFGYATTGHDRNSIRQARRGVALSALAAETVR